MVTSSRFPEARPASRRCDIGSEDGSITIFTIVMFLMMFVVTGMAVDYMRHETYRSEMQNALDRGLLAAADLDQTITDEEAEEIVKEYFLTAPHVGTLTIPDVTVLENSVIEEGIGSRAVEATASIDINTFFLRVIGYPTMTINVAGAAEEIRKDVELSLVLDISGTMRYCNDVKKSNCSETEDRRIERLIPAAEKFIDRIVTADSAGTTTVNVIPYAGSVNPGPELFAALGGQRKWLANGGSSSDPNADYASSSCLELKSEDFVFNTLPNKGYYEQVPHFHYYTTEEYWMNWGWCPDDSTAITVMENDATKLKTAISNLRTSLHDGTGTDIGMKWAISLLHPKSKDRLSPLVATEFKGVRPRPWKDNRTLKVIVLMTDGMITGQKRPKSPNATINATKEVNNQGRGKGKTITSESDAVAQFGALCTQAKTKDVIIYTIAFEAPSRVVPSMKSCSTDADTHFYEVTGTDGISLAFDEIATTLSKIKLVQ